MNESGAESDRVPRGTRRSFKRSDKRVGNPAGSESSAKFHVFVKDFGVAFSRISVSSGIGCSRVSFPAVFQRGRYYPVDTMKAQSCGGIGRFHRPVPGPRGSRYAGPAQRLLRRVASFLQPLSSPADTRQLFFNAGKTTARADPCANLQPYLVFQLDEAARCSLGPAVNAAHCPSVAADSSCEAKQTECLPPLCSSFSSPLTSSVFLRPPLFLFPPHPYSSSSSSPYILPQPVSCSFTPLSVHTLTLLPPQPSFIRCG